MTGSAEWTDLPAETRARLLRPSAPARGPRPAGVHGGAATHATSQPSPSEVIQDLIGALTQARSPHRAYRAVGTAGAAGKRTVSAIVEVTNADGSTHVVRVEVHDAHTDA